MPPVLENNFSQQKPDQLPDGLAETLFANSPDCIFLIDTSFKIIACNKAAEAATGLQNHALAGKSIFESYKALNRESVTALLKKVLQGEQVSLRELEYRFLADSEKEWADLQLYSFNNPKNKEEVIVCAARNVTEQVKTRIALREKEFTYRKIEEKSADMAFRCDPEGRFTYISPALEKVSGYAPEDVIGRPVSGFIEPAFATKIALILLDVLKTDKPVIEVYPFKYKNGEYRWLESSIFKLPGIVNGLNIQIQVISRDVTIRKQAEEMLRDKSKLLNGLLSNLPVMVKRISADGTPVFMQGKGLRKIGLDNDKWRSANITFSTEEAREMVKKAMKGESVSIIETYIHHGKPVNFRSYYFPDLENSGGAIGFSIDITEQKQAEERLMRNQVFIQKITDSTPFVITIFDYPRQEFIYTNRQVPEMLGYSLEEVKNLGPAVFLKMVHPDDLQRLAGYVEEVALAADGEIKSIEMRVRDKSGSWRWFMSRSSVFRRDANGKALRALSVTQDIDDVRKSKDLLSGVLDSSPNAIMAMQAVRDGSGLITDFEWVLVNATTSKITTDSAEDLLGKRFLEVMPQHLESGLFGQYVEVVQSGRPMNADILTTIKGANVWLQINAVKMGDGCVVTIADITEAKEAREKIRRNEALLQEAQKIAHLGIYEWDLKTNSIYWSDELYRMYGLEPGSIPVNLNMFLSWLHPEDADRIKSYLETSVSESQPLDVQYKIIAADGSIKVVAAKGEIVSGVSGKPIKVLGTVLDITELVTVKQELESIRQLRSIGEAIPQMVWTSTPDGANDYMNRRWFEYTGLQEYPDKGWDWSKVIHEDDIGRTLKRWSHSLETGKELIAEFRIRNAQGYYRWHLIRMLPMRDEEGKIIKWFGTATDIERQKQIQQELEEAKIVLSEYNERLNQKNAELQKINSDLDNFIYTASHDLKAPIHNIEGLIDVLISEIDTHNPVVDEVLSKIHLSINRFKATVLDLTEISKVERALQEAATVLKLPDLLQEIELDIQPLITESQAEIRKDLQATSVVFSRKNMRSVLYNLISNGIKYQSPLRKPVIQLQTHYDSQNNFILTVTDNGLGIEEKNLGKVFEMFRRIYTHVEGAGVGLYIVKRMVENAGGTIEIKSTFGVGSTFVITIPQS